MDTFTWKPLVNPVGQIRHRSLSAKFGDGYEQVAGDGIHTKTQTWPLQFRGRASYITPIRTFLDDHAHTAFQWTIDPTGEILVVRAPEYDLRFITHDLHELSVTFTEFHKP